MLKTHFFDHYKHYCCYSLISDLANTYEKIYISAISKVLAMIKGMTLHFGCSRFTMSLKKFFTIKFELPIDTQSQSITDGSFHGSRQRVEKTGISLQIEHVPESSDGNLRCHIFCFEDVFDHIKK